MKASGGHYEVYRTPAWVVQAVAPLLPAGDIVDPCAGDGAILDALGRGAGIEIRPDAPEHPSVVRGVDFLAWREPLDVAAWVINPPFSLAREFITHCMTLAPGAPVWALLRTGWLFDGEARTGRVSWLRSLAPDVWGLPRRPSFTADGRCDSSTYAWVKFKGGGKWGFL